MVFVVRVRTYLVLNRGAAVTATAATRVTDLSPAMLIIHVLVCGPEERRTVVGKRVLGVIGVLQADWNVPAARGVVPDGANNVARRVLEVRRPLAVIARRRVGKVDYSRRGHLCCVLLL